MPAENIESVRAERGGQRVRGAVPESIDRDGLQRLVDAGAQLVEVLPEEEYAWAHLPGAVNIPLRELPTRAEELDRGRPVVVYCHDTL